MPIGSNIYGKEKMNNKLNLSIEYLAQVFKDYEFAVNPVVVSLCRQVRFLKNGLGKILRTLDSLNRSNTEQLTIKDESEFIKDFKSVGFLVPLNCGHNGKYNEEEKNMVLQHLKQAKFIY